MIPMLNSPARRATGRPISTVVSRKRTLTKDAALRRDPTSSNDIRRRLQTQLRQAINEWRSKAYAAIVEADVLGYQYGDVDPNDIEELANNLNAMLRQQAYIALSPSYDNLNTALRTAYGRGVNTAMNELGAAVPMAPDQEVIDQAFREFANILDNQLTIAIQQLVENPEKPSRSRWLLWAMVLLPVLFRAIAPRLRALANTNVTKAFNEGKLDTYAASGVDQVGILPEHLPTPLPRPTPTTEREQELEELEEDIEEGEAEPEELLQELLPGGLGYLVPEPLRPPGRPAVAAKRPRYWTVQTMGDDKVCAICESYEGQAFTLDEARRIIPAHPNCRCSVVPLE